MKENFVNYFLNLPIDFWNEMWYNRMFVGGALTAQARRIFAR